MKRLPVLLLCAGAVTLAGCTTHTSQAPNAINHTRTEQIKLQAAHHWEVFAEYESTRILETLKDKSKPIYIEPPGPNGSPFATAYHGLLIEHLTDQGAVVVTKPVFGAVRVSYFTQILTHRDRGYTAPAQGTYTALGASAVLVGVAAKEWSPSALAALPVLVAADITSGSWVKIEPTEVIITTRVLEGNLVMLSDTDIFYFNPGDAGHYLDTVALSRGQVFQVVDK